MSGTITFMETHHVIDSGSHHMAKVKCSDLQNIYLKTDQYYTFGNTCMDNVFLRML